MGIVAKRSWRGVLGGLAAVLIACLGCGDDSVRGAGSIDIPRSALKSYIPAKKPAAPTKVEKPAPVGTNR